MVKLAPITIPAKPIGSIPRPADLIERVRSHIETSEEGPDRVRSNPARIGAGARETVNF